MFAPSSSRGNIIGGKRSEISVSDLCRLEEEEREKEGIELKLFEGREERERIGGPAGKVNE